MTPPPSIGIVVPTLNAGAQIDQCLGPILRSPSASHYRILVIDSSSTDDTIERVTKLGVASEVIARSEFDHGLTRNYARKKLGTPFVVCITQDAHPSNEFSIERLVKPLVDGVAEASYGRQIPRPGCDFIEAYAREFSYGPESFLKSWEDREKYQLRLYMCSNSFAAYNNAALDRVGGFPKTIFGEDFLTAMALIKSGGKIAYQADAVVEHSHAYEFRSEVKRNFLIGVMHSLHSELFEGLPRKDRSGATFARGLFKKAYEAAGLAGVAKSFVYLAARLISYHRGRSAGLHSDRFKSYR